MRTILAVAYSDWLLPLLIAAVPAAASAVAAVLAARSARTSRAAELDAARIRDLEDRLAERKYGVYEPMIDALGQIFEKEESGKPKLDERDLMAKLSEFASWITIFGSDEALKAFHNMMQGAFASAPPQVALRLYAEFVLASRRDMGDRSSNVTAAEILGVRINDLYTDEATLSTVRLPFEALCARHGWSPPWVPSPSQEAEQAYTDRSLRTPSAGAAAR